MEYTPEQETAQPISSDIQNDHYLKENNKIDVEVNTDPESPSQDIDVVMSDESCEV